MKLLFNHPLFIFQVSLTQTQFGGNSSDTTTKRKLDLKVGTIKIPDLADYTTQNFIANKLI